MSRTLSILGGLFALTALPLSAAEAPNPVEVKLRESLRNTMLQLRTEQTERATLQAKQTESEAKIKELTAKVDSLTKQAASEQAASRKQIDELGAQSEKRQQLIVRLEETLEKWKAGYAKAAELVRTTDAQRAKLSDENAILKGRVAEQRTKNVALHKLAVEILDRYEKFGLGDAIKAREPFTGITRARLETLVQDYQDKIDDQRIKPEPSKQAAAKPKS